ncbi:O-antigen polymerase [Pseudoalteromonas tetraodonis]|uniref:O-antigen polymerase n=1 Tax=Pseudoalteromonas tetraodonis TaxID=43659 RepID=UPI0008499B85|nr:O-antigen polymerase [Pseudoalteromonas tetraodonis]ODS13136.1 hypothetical protein BCD66_14515 [Pseudoalteromonas tetraodonis]
MTVSAFFAGLMLIFVSVLAYKATRDIIHPGVVFPFVWASALVTIAFLPLIGFYPVNGYALLLFLVGGMLFSLISISMHYLLIKRVYPPQKTIINLKNLNFLVLILFFTNMIVFYSAISDFMALGGDVAQSAYVARQKSVQGEQVFNPLISNYMMFGLVIIPILTVSLINEKLKILPYLLITLPWIGLILLFSGRASLISLLLVLLFIYYLMKREAPLRLFIYLGVSFLLIIVAGALAVNKVDMAANESFSDTVVGFIKHIAAYAFQGPVLFSRYFDGNASVTASWSPFSSIQHILSLIGLAPPPPSINLEFNHYGTEVDMDGNVYSLYFSLYPNNGMFGAFVILISYAMVSTYIYHCAKSGKLVYVLLSAYIFSATILSIFSDRFLTSVWFFIKLTIIVLLVKLIIQLSSRFVWRDDK